MVPGWVSARSQMVPGGSKREKSVIFCRKLAEGGWAVRARSLLVFPGAARINRGGSQSAARWPGARGSRDGAGPREGAREARFGAWMNCAFYYTVLVIGPLTTEGERQHVATHSNSIFASFFAFFPFFRPRENPKKKSSTDVSSIVSRLAKLYYGHLTSRHSRFTPLPVRWAAIFVHRIRPRCTFRGVKFDDLRQKRHFCFFHHILHQKLTTMWKLLKIMTGC